MFRILLTYPKITAKDNTLIFVVEEVVSEYLFVLTCILLAILRSLDSDRDRPIQKMSILFGTSQKLTTQTS